MLRCNEFVWLRWTLLGWWPQGVLPCLLGIPALCVFTSLPSVCLRPSGVENGRLCGTNISLVVVTTSTALRGLCIMRTLRSVSWGFPRVFWGSQGLASLPLSSPCHRQARGDCSSAPVFPLCLSLCASQPFTSSVALALTIYCPNYTVKCKFYYLDCIIHSSLGDAKLVDTICST